MGVRDEFALSKASGLGEGTTVTVLGSGGGLAVWKRNGPSVAITCNGSAYLVDFGLRALRQYR